MKYRSEDEIVEEVIRKVGKTIVLGAPLAAGKPNHIMNAFYRRAAGDPSIELTICTALTLERPKGKSDLEQRFLGPFQERVFGDYPDLEYELARVKEALPPNIRVVEFYFPPGKYLHNATAQRHYVSTNYTHVVRDMLDRGINVLAQLVAAQEVDGELCFSLSSNPDVTIDMAAALRNCGYPVAMVAQVNNQMPFMMGDALVTSDFYDFVLDDPSKYFTIFGPPKMSVSDADYMIGLYSSTLVRDDGELQIGIGSLGDSTIYALLQRHRDNPTYRELLKELKVEEKFGSVIDRLGDLKPFDKGLFGATEMVVDGFMHLFKAGIIKRKVYDQIDLQRLLNEGVLKERFGKEVIALLVDRKIIRKRANRADFEFLKYWGILKATAEYRDGKSLEVYTEEQLGTELLHGQVIHGGFFLGPQNFYEWLRTLPDEEKELINMKSVQKINQLYGHEMIDRLHRKNARFINSCMMYTIIGNAVSDGLEDGRVVSGVGGQYNFVAMAQELPDGHSILTLRSTRTEKGKAISNIVPFYGHVTIPRHLRDVVITEYGIAFIRGKTDEEIIKALLNITDSRFQPKLMAFAKQHGKLAQDYTIPEAFRGNTPESYAGILAKYKERGLFPVFPFGTDLTDDEKKIGKALKSLAADQHSKWVFLKTVLGSLGQSPRPQDIPLLERMGLAKPKTLVERLYQKLLLTKFRSFGY